jgi:hypothetical protein|tara:strand:- start:5141 stop:5491 length:351 start_codon:yes stop_codon:yes gene_type:complete
MAIDELTKLAEKGKEAGKEWVVAKEIADKLEEGAAPFLASIKNELDRGGMSEAKLDRLAKGSAEYSQHITGMCSARAAANLAKVKMSYYDKLWESKRSQMSLLKVQVDRGIYEKGV